ncbi:hypothetical protein RCG17_10180 [Neobacillus sp. PS3-12]|uniref:hypothetical protein n=1 Tax=Neobacillus sp. PS3-12 TaxID=3070677 RepID=UPI0027DF720B|nr:hypothetical protein [Neobacillus sp. PS3-12]WML54928.1 hypothetical protein RCG17_10180 [Neobacillus sp. PS3-12]
MQKSVISLDAFNLGYDYEKMKILEELARLKKENDKLRSDLNALRATSTNHNESEEKFEQLFNNISDAVYYLKIDDHGVDLQELLKNVVDILTNEALGQSVSIQTKFPKENIIIHGAGRELKKLFLNPVTEEAPSQSCLVNKVANSSSFFI